jgi:hypothetical protein
MHEEAGAGTSLGVMSVWPRSIRRKRRFRIRRHHLRGGFSPSRLDVHDPRENDRGFLPAGDGANEQIISPSLQSNGQILIGGGFDTYNGTLQGCGEDIEWMGSEAYYDDLWPQAPDISTGDGIFMPLAT